MENILLHALTVFMGFFAIMNPIANVPIFISLTSGDDEQTTTAIAFRSLMLAFIIVTLFSVAGKVIFELLFLSSVFTCCKESTQVFNIRVTRTNKSPGKLHSVLRYLHWRCRYLQGLGLSLLR